ncbi:DUF4167 domain-containing protein [Sphingomonas bacterium]|uniref:DUF4167 domain-containing protein n=1 Tax=Sphingomonas bacterium TaxID=1895847 RepID=UPI0020C63F7F|nr:DUF4167 domain-containing protein [Sphingomonas bacterium]
MGVVRYHQWRTTSDKEQAKLINNRQNGRRRGRGGQQARSGQPGGQDRGNRIDNRARGNAAQLLEKYKNMARDAQMQGDRVNTEYYLQFADHYFRVLSESRARFEEQRPRRDDGSREEYGAEGDFAEDGQRGYDQRGGQNDGWNDGEEDQLYAPPPVQERRPAPQPRVEERQDAREEGDRRPRRPRNTNNGGYANGGGNGGNGNGGDAAPAQDERASRIEVDRLPQGFGATGSDDMSGAGEVVDTPAPRPRRAPRRPREEAPAADV